MKKLDDAEIYLLNFEQAGTPPSAATTHIGMFLAWALLKGLGASSHINFDYHRLKAREITGSEFLNRYCGSTLVDKKDLNETGAAFANWYYDRYFHDYLDTFGLSPNASLDVLAKVSDNWQNYERVATVLDTRLLEWMEATGLSASSLSDAPDSTTAKNDSTAPTFASGARVGHGRFGPGEVLTSTVEAGRERVLIKFDSGAEKWLAVGIAPLTLLHDS
ncbi:hypothetical protein [Aquimonas voraii]|uniref:DUF7832 domain-containing protein n=1 Tax=Aquimonas voraii TaxID=265719 RepID=A0A1G7A6Z6_9GAMM|nr:hypothetical protein [Aquimonas voraii]SDE10267.1 hypothetical protein SAMN04488509_11936 [Aquimonas voraii]